jgi:3-methyladenine DNA glycosylase/8-oxoguanine DNA glycosylase
VLGEGWRPWRSAASLLLWRWYGGVLKNRAGAGIPMTESGKRA